MGSITVPNERPPTDAGGPLGDLRDEMNDLRARRQQVERDMAAINDQIELLARQVHRAATKALRRAALRGNDTTVYRLLSDLGDIDVNARDKNGATALFLAVHRDDNAEVIGLLLKAGANPNRRDFDRTTPLIAAVRPTQLQLVRMLVDAGAEINVSNRDGDTPLTNAAAWGADDVVRYLLERGADPTMTDGAGLTAADLARQREQAPSTATDVVLGAPATR